MTSMDTSTYAFLGSFLHKKMLNIVFTDQVGIKTNIIQTGFIVNEWTFIIIIIIWGRVLILREIKLKTFLQALKSILDLINRVHLCLVLKLTLGWCFLNISVLSSCGCYTALELTSLSSLGGLFWQQLAFLGTCPHFHHGCSYPHRLLCYCCYSHHFCQDPGVF